MYTYLYYHTYVDEMTGPRTGLVAVRCGFMTSTGITNFGNGVTSTVKRRVLDVSASAC